MLIPTAIKPPRAKIDALIKLRRLRFVSSLIMLSPQDYILQK